MYIIKVQTSNVSVNVSESHTNLEDANAWAIIGVDYPHALRDILP
jgi:hypothetical protein